jgi:ABC-2 type transport system ATP-binding protein
MRQKLSICCAYLINPKALIFDEPLTGLDPRGMRSIQESIRIRADAGAAIIISSHILSLVETLCTHVLVLDKGCKILCDSMDGVMQAVGADRDSASLESVFLDITRSNSEQ